MIVHGGMAQDVGPILEMVNARLKKPEVDVLDDHGTRGQGVVNSPEYQLLRIV